MRPKMLARVSMRDIWRPASKAACKNNPWKQIQAAFSIFFPRSTLQEPAYQELVLLYNKSKEGIDEVPGLQLHTYTKIPVPDLKGAIFVYTLIHLEGRSKSMSTQEIATLCERYLYNNFKDQVEMPMQEIMCTLLRLGLVVEDSTEPGSYISALPDGKAIAALKK